MATEILGFLIIVGILIVFIVRRDLWNGTSSKADEVEEASVKMRLQMEHSANAIITQMDSRIHQLEGLVTAADERARMLEQQMAAVRADQERAQQRAEKEFAEMRAAQASYYVPQEAVPMPPYRSTMRGEGWHARGEYRPRAASPGRSLRPIEGVSSVRRSEFVPHVRPEDRRDGADFAETLSDSMYAAESGDNAYRRAQDAYYEHGRSSVNPQADYPRSGRYSRDMGYAREDAYDEREYAEHYDAQSYPVEPYPAEETWEQYVEQPRRAAPPQGIIHARHTRPVPVEMAVEETPAVIVDSTMLPRQDDYAQEVPEDEGSAFSQEQMEELARTEAEVVVSSSVADVVDLPMAPDGEEQAYDSAGDEDVHVFAATDTGGGDSPIPASSKKEESAFSDEDVFAEAEPVQAEDELMQPGRFEEQDLFEEENNLESTDVEETAFSASEEEDLASDEAENVPEEAEPFDVKEIILSETGDKTTHFETEEDAWETQETAAAEALVESDDEISEDAIGEEDISDISAATMSGEKEMSPRPPSPTIRARELLAQGMPPDEVAKETGMGRSAVELLTQMAQGQLNSQEDD